MLFLRQRDTTLVALFVATVVVVLAVVWSMVSSGNDASRAAAYEGEGTQSHQRAEGVVGEFGSAENSENPEVAPTGFHLPQGEKLEHAPGAGQQDYVRMVDQQGRERYAIVSVPEDYSPEKPLPVVLGLGGWTDTPENFRDYSKLEQSTMGREALVVYPQAVDNAWEGAPYSVTKHNEDVQFLVDLTARLAATYTVDADRIGAVGMSNGGGMAVELACQAPGFLRGMVMVSGAYYERDFADCSRSQVDTLVVHGLKDGLMDYAGGVAHGARFVGVEDALRRFAELNECGDDFAQGDISDRFSGERVEQKKMKQCSRAVELWTLPDEGHTWYLDPDMAEESWNFLR